MRASRTLLHVISKVLLNVLYGIVTDSILKESLYTCMTIKIVKNFIWSLNFILQSIYDI